jgi:hypothetical protein
MASEPFSIPTRIERFTCNYSGNMASAMACAGGLLSDDQSRPSGGSSGEGECARKHPASGALRLRPVCERETSNERPFLAKPLLFVSSGHDSPMDRPGLGGTWNPVRAGIVSDAGDYAWSSARTRLSDSDGSEFLDLVSWR